MWSRKKKLVRNGNLLYEELLYSVCMYVWMYVSMNYTLVGENLLLLYSLMPCECIALIHIKMVAQHGRYNCKYYDIILAIIKEYPQYAFGHYEHFGHILVRLFITASIV